MCLFNPGSPLFDLEDGNFGLVAAALFWDCRRVSNCRRPKWSSVVPCVVSVALSLSPVYLWQTNSDKNRGQKMKEGTSEGGGKAADFSAA